MRRVTESANVLSCDRTWVVGDTDKVSQRRRRRGMQKVDADKERSGVQKSELARNGGGPAALCRQGGRDRPAIGARISVAKAEAKENRQGRGPPG